MIIMTLNCRDLASLAKNIALRRLIDLQRPNVIFLQELMCAGEGIVVELHKFLVG